MPMQSAMQLQPANKMVLLQEQSLWHLSFLFVKQFFNIYLATSDQVSEKNDCESQLVGIGKVGFDKHAQNNF